MSKTSKKMRDILGRAEAWFGPGTYNVEGVGSDMALVDFWSAVHRHPILVGRYLFPTRPKGYVSATETLAAMAMAVATSRKLRRKGDIRGALVYEGHTDIYYDSLPQFVRY